MTSYYIDDIKFKQPTEIILFFNKIITYITNFIRELRYSYYFSLIL